MDVDGNVVAMSSKPEGSPLMDKVKARSYPLREWGGFVWARLGEMTFKEHLLAAGKAKKLVIVACARKLLTVLNAMMRTGTTYRDAIA